MSQSLSVGLTGLPPGWKRIMQQERIKHSVCSLSKPVAKNAFAAIIVNSHLNEKQAENAIKFLHSGGAILSAYNFVSKIYSSIRFEEKHAKFIEPHSDFFVGSGLLWLNSRAAFFAEQKNLGKRGFARQNHAVFEGAAKPSALLKRIGKGSLIVLPFDPESAILSEKFERRAFVVGKKAVGEFAPSASKSHIRKVVSNCLQRLFELRGLPFVHLWYYPKKFSSVLSFHVDVDFFSDDTIKTIQLFKEINFQPTWFLNMQAAASAEKEIIAQLKKQKFIGQHAFLHQFFSNEKQSYLNAVKADLEIKKLGFKPCSFSAPNGVWGQGIAKAVQRLGYDFAMGFSLDSENLPFNPIVDGKEAGFLFLPTHPVCIGLMKMYDCSEKEMIRYFKAIIERNSALGIPLFFYGHPFKEIARFQNVIKEVFSAARARKDIWVASHLQFAQWWRKRQGIAFKAVADEGKVKINCRNSKDAFFRIVFNGKQTFAMAKNSEIELRQLRKGKKLPCMFLHDTAVKPSGLGKKHLAKKFAAWGVKKVFWGKALK